MVNVSLKISPVFVTSARGSIFRATVTYLKFWNLESSAKIAFFIMLAQLNLVTKPDPNGYKAIYSF